MVFLQRVTKKIAGLTKTKMWYIITFPLSNFLQFYSDNTEVSLNSLNQQYSLLHFFITTFFAPEYMKKGNCRGSSSRFFFFYIYNAFVVYFLICHYHLIHHWCSFGNYPKFKMKSESGWEIWIPLVILLHIRLFTCIYNASVRHYIRWKVLIIEAYSWATSKMFKFNVRKLQFDNISFK